MGYGDHREDRPEDTQSAVAAAPKPIADSVQGWLGVLGEVLSLGVRAIGVALLLAGLWVSFEVVQEAWALYRDPGRIATLATAMEQGTGIDALLRNAVVGAGDASESSNAPKLSFLLAWFIAPVLLFTAGYLAMLAVRTGGTLALGPSKQR